MHPLREISNYFRPGLFQRRRSTPVKRVSLVEGSAQLPNLKDRLSRIRAMTPGGDIFDLLLQEGFWFRPNDLSCINEAKSCRLGGKNDMNAEKEHEIKISPGARSRISHLGDFMQHERWDEDKEQEKELAARAEPNTPPPSLSTNSHTYAGRQRSWPLIAHSTPPRISSLALPERLPKECYSTSAWIAKRHRTSDQLASSLSTARPQMQRDRSNESIPSTSTSSARLLFKKLPSLPRVTTTTDIFNGPVTPSPESPLSSTARYSTQDCLTNETRDTSPSVSPIASRARQLIFPESTSLESMAEDEKCDTESVLISDDDAVDLDLERVASCGVSARESRLERPILADRYDGENAIIGIAEVRRGHRGYMPGVGRVSRVLKPARSVGE